MNNNTKHFTVLIILAVTVLYSFSHTYAQRNTKTEIVTVIGTAEIEWPSSKSRDAIRDEVREAAIINALQSAFGEVVFRDSRVLVINKTEGTSVETKTHFEMIGNTLVKGKLRRVIKEDYEEIKHNIKDRSGRDISVSFMKCIVEIEAEPISEPAYNTISYPVLNGTRRTYDFNNKEELNLFFKAPFSGYVSVYYEDRANKVVYRILPEEKDKDNYETGIPVSPDRPFVFFENAGYVLYTTQLQETNRLYIIFSRSINQKPSMGELNPRGIISEEHIKQGYTLPYGLISDDFYKWLNEYKGLSSDLNVDYIDITIKK